jgi:hypothetical protein
MEFDETAKQFRETTSVAEKQILLDRAYRLIEQAQESIVRINCSAAKGARGISMRSYDESWSMQRRKRRSPMPKRSP